jgi:hypothetical protein
MCKCGFIFIKKLIFILFKGKNQGCGSGSGLDPDSATLWIRIRIGNPDPGSGSRGKKVKKFQWKNALFSYFLNKFYHQKGIKLHYFLREKKFEEKHR